MKPLQNYQFSYSIALTGNLCRTMATTDSTDSTDEHRQHVGCSESQAPCPVMVSGSSVVHDLTANGVYLPPFWPHFHNLIGRLISKDNMLLISQQKVVVGRVSANTVVDYHVARNKVISRKHFILRYSANEFEAEVLSKNGLYVDDVFLPQSTLPYTLSKNCVFRFPNTDIKVILESRIEPTVNVGVLVNKGGHLSPTRDVMSYESASTAGAISPDDANSSENRVQSVQSSSTASNMLFELCRAIAGSLEQLNYNPEEVNRADVSLDGNSSTGSNATPTTSEEQHLSGNRDAIENESAIDVKESFDYVKPPYSYAQLIVQAITLSPERQCTLPEIYAFMRGTYPYFRQIRQEGWQNSIRHNLSLNRYFIKVPRVSDTACKGCYWRIDPACYDALEKKRFQKRLQMRGRLNRVGCRSAPASPVYSDDMRADLSLGGSAPGSPLPARSYAHDNSNDAMNYSRS
uniref:Fork-head domain-containing protein n=1 Tax=Anopheles christyi TaxID=43041 RepID=A0A182KF78_9DIPT